MMNELRNGMFKLEGVELVSWTAKQRMCKKETYECNGEVCGTGNERRPCNVLVAVKSKNIDICGRIVPRRVEPRAGDSHHSHYPKVTYRYCNVVSTYWDGKYAMRAWNSARLASLALENIGKVAKVES